jgi:hypothetical protein
VTHDEAITLFMATVGKRIVDSEEGAVLTASQLAMFVVYDNTNENVAAFVDTFKGECGCPSPQCVNRVVDAVTKCMTFIQARGESRRPQNAPSTQRVQ